MLSSGGLPFDSPPPATRNGKRDPMTAPITDPEVLRRTIAEVANRDDAIDASDAFAGADPGVAAKVLLSVPRDKRKEFQAAAILASGVAHPDLLPLYTASLAAGSRKARKSLVATMASLDHPGSVDVLLAL